MNDGIGLRKTVQHTVFCKINTPIFTIVRNGSVIMTFMSNQEMASDEHKIISNYIWIECNIHDC